MNYPQNQFNPQWAQSQSKELDGWNSYRFSQDPVAGTVSLINCGYRLYGLTLPETEEREALEVRVWAKPVKSLRGWKKERVPFVGWDGVSSLEYPVYEYSLPDLSAISEGAVRALPFNKEVVREDDFVLLDVEDGAEQDTVGVLVVGRVRVLPIREPVGDDDAA